MPAHVFFDLDKTLTASRSPMAPAHQALFERLLGKADVVVVSGGNREQIREQVTARFDDRYFTLAQSGNHAIDKNGHELWDDVLPPEQVKATLAFIESLKDYFNLPVSDPEDLVENRGAQISYSVIGFHESVEKKYAFDPDDSKRQEALRSLASGRRLLKEAGVEVVPAGTTTYNFVALGKDKGFNIARFIGRMEWRKEDCLYIGDALFKGGNDESVIGVIPTQPVKDPDDTFRFVEKNLLS